MMKTWALLFVALPLCACGMDEAAEDEAIAEAEGEVILNNGVSLNGVGINGVGINGVGINGVGINGVGINGVGINGVGINGSSLTGTSGSQSLTGADFVGATLTAYLANGATVTLRVDGVAPSPNAPDILYYTVAYDNAGTWVPLCGTDAQSAPIPAIAHAGRWDSSMGTPTGGDWIDDPTNFTFACRYSTVAKCTELGYAPWRARQECDGATCATRSLRAWHQACTRMIRADYCGDGQYHTHNGVPINVWDNLGIQSQDQVPSDWENDAEWGPEGAICVKDFRLTNTGDTSSYVGQHCPHNRNQPGGCFKNKSNFFTENGFSTDLDERSLIRNQSDPIP